MLTNHQNNSCISLVADQQIASVADHGIGNIHQPKVFLDLTELLFVFQIDQAICRATDPEGGMQFHRFL